MVTTWILILSFLARDYHSSSAMTTVGPFATREECVHAGDLWLHQASQASDTSFSNAPRAVCVRTTAPQPTVTY